jgi:hypothetical protein
VVAPQLEMTRGDLGTEVIKRAESAWWRGHVDGVRHSSNQKRESPYPLCVNKLGIGGLP